MVNTGLTLFGETRPGSKRMSFGKRSMLIDHSNSNSIDGLITLVGVRATVARSMAEKVIGIVGEKLKKKISKSETNNKPIYGGDFDIFNELLRKAGKDFSNLTDKSIINSLVRNHGSNYINILKYIKENPQNCDEVGASKVIKAEIIHAVREEMAVRLSDIVFRRTNLGTAEYPGEEAITESADIIAKELGWSVSKTLNEIEEVNNSFENQGSRKEYKPSVNLNNITL